jgi:uncharacterized protein YjbJ (UPF0337 family)
MANKNVDQVKGRVKEAAGALTGDRRLKSEGEVDQAEASLKKAVDKVAEAVKGHPGDGSPHAPPRTRSSHQSKPRASSRTQ